MNEAKDLLNGFVEYYRTGDKPRQYSPRMAMDIADRYSWISRAYKLALHDEVVRSFTPTATRPLPDMAALAAAERQLPPAETMRDQTRSLPDPEEERQVSFIRQEVNAKAKAEGEVNHHERQRVRDRRNRGDATLHELWWLECIEHHGAKYRAMPEGYEERHPGVARW